MDHTSVLQAIRSWLTALPGAAKIGIAMGAGAVVLAGGVAVAAPRKNTVFQTPETAQTGQPAVQQTASAVPVSTAQVPLQETADATLLSATQDAGRSYLDETLFIGDSNTARYMMYADDTGTAFTTQANNIGVVSMGAGAITTLKCEQFSGYNDMYTIPDAVAMLKPRRFIICFGTNNLGGTSTDATKFIETYSKGIRAIETSWPYADIIVSAIPPLDAQRENTNLYMTQVDAYNEAILAMCEENGWHFLNSAEVLRDAATGWAKKDYTLSDGVHLSKTAVTEYFTYVRTHALVTEDRRPQPLGSIPTPIGPPVNLINQDPIAVRGAKVPLEFVATNGGSLSGSTSQLVKKGATASAVTAVPDGGFRFVGWTASNGTTYGGQTISFTMPSNADAGGVVLTAHFEPDEHEHDYAEVEGTRVAPGCLTAGSAKYRCTICGDTIEKELPPLGHQWDGGTVSGDGLKRVYTCAREGCGMTWEEILATPSPIPHTHSYTRSEIPATCTDAGYYQYSCACGDSYKEENGQAALGHNTDRVLEENGMRNFYCSRCGDLIRQEQIQQPETPSEPETPAEPETPSESETPAEPETPAGPETPSEAETLVGAKLPAEEDPSVQNDNNGEAESETPE